MDQRDALPYQCDPMRTRVTVIPNNTTGPRDSVCVLCLGRNGKWRGAEFNAKCSYPVLLVRVVTHGGHVLILHCAHAPNLARGVVCGHKNRNKIALICMKIRVGLQTKALWDPIYLSRSIKSLFTALILKNRIDSLPCSVTKILKRGE